MLVFLLVRCVCTRKRTVGLLVWSHVFHTNVVKERLLTGNLIYERNKTYLTTDNIKRHLDEVKSRTRTRNYTQNGYLKVNSSLFMI